VMYGAYVQSLTAGCGGGHQQASGVGRRGSEAAGEKV